MLIDIHTHKEFRENVFSIKNATLSEKLLSEKKYSVGIHPWDVTSKDEAKEELLSELVKSKAIIAIGECGIDRLKNNNLFAQIKEFIFQAELAHNSKLPLLIHSVRGFEFILKVLHRINIPVIIHGINEKESIARKYLAEGFYLSFGKQILNEISNAAKLLPKIPINRIFLETDNAKEIEIETIYEKASNLLQIDRQILEKQIETNFKTVFNFEAK